MLSGNTVVCFEPELIKNNYENMIIENKSVIGERGKHKTMFYSNVTMKEIEVDSITLDEWYEINKCNFKTSNMVLLKINIKKGSLDVLYGASNLLKLCSIYGKCNVEIKCGDILNNNFDEINKLMNTYEYVSTNNGDYLCFVPKKTTVIIEDSRGRCGMCNTLKNLISIIRIKNKFNCNIHINKHNELNNLFIFPDPLFEYNDNDRHIERYNWRFAIFDDDKNLDKIVNDKFSLMFQDFRDHIFFQNYKYNCIDCVYRNDLFNDIYEEYGKIFNELIIKQNILDIIDDFCKTYFNKNTISVHIRSWVDCADRQQFCDITKFYDKIEEFNDGINTFFISSDNVNICNNIKNKFGDKIIIYTPVTNDSLVNSFIDLMLLSKNNILFGSYISTFTELAYIINYNIDKKIYIV